MNEQHVTDEHESVFAAMRRQIALTPIPSARRATLRQRLATHPRLAVTGASALIAIAAAVAAVLAAGAFTSPPPAFAVTLAGNTVTISVHKFAALNSLNARLAADNIPIRAVPVVAGCTATARVVGANGPNTRVIKAGFVSGPGGITIRLSHLAPPGDTLVVGWSGHSLLLGQVIKGPVPTCIGIGPTLINPKRQ